MNNSGTFIIRVRKNKDGTFRWYLKFQVSEKGDTKEVAVLVNQYHEFGLSKSMTVLEAKDRVKRLNRERRIDSNSKINSARRSADIIQTHDVLFPKEFLSEFLIQLEERTHGTEYRFKKVCSHFVTAQKMIIETRLFPKDYAYRANKIYKWLVQKKYSADYSNSIIRVLNIWGKFIARKQGQFFESVPNPRGIIRANIIKSQKTQSGRRPVCLPLNEILLGKLKDKLPSEFYFWIYISFYLGLRPLEVDSLKEGVEIEHFQDTDILIVDQPKLSGISEEERIKRIPLILEEQKNILFIINNKQFIRPRAKHLRRVLGDNYDLYTGRKGFTDLMLQRGQSLEDISQWLGHKSIDRTWRSYKNKQRVSWKKVSRGEE